VLFDGSSRQTPECRTPSHELRDGFKGFARARWIDRMRNVFEEKIAWIRYRTPYSQHLREFAMGSSSSCPHDRSPL
jgi:hypothetical protein